LETVALIRDLAIILLGILNIVLLVVAIIIGVLVLKLAKYLGREFPPIMQTVQQTLKTVQGTTEFIGETVAKPAIGAASTSAGFREFLRAFVGVRRPSRRS
jgi:hypothetical protein